MIRRRLAMSQPVLVILGCRVRSAAALRRIRAGARAFHEGKSDLIVASGGRVWDGVVEADAMAEALEAEGVHARAILRERCSFSTRENARYTADILTRRGTADVIVVTCTWHLPRAERAFAKRGLRVEGIGVPAPVDRVRSTYYETRERIALWLGH